MVAPKGAIFFGNEALFFLKMAMILSSFSYVVDLTNALVVCWLTRWSILPALKKEIIRRRPRY